MAGDGRDDLVPLDLSLLETKIQARTPARLLAGRSGAAYRTATQLRLREDHAAARDAVQVELSLEDDLGRAFMEEQQIFEVCTEARTKEEYLRFPDLGRRLSAVGSAEIANRCQPGRTFQMVIGDGLSVAAVSEQVPKLLPGVLRGAKSRGWTTGLAFVIRHCRVGVMNHIGELLSPEVLLLLIGERPGLATAASLSAYMAFRPGPGQTDADRNLVSNIHARGTPIARAAESIFQLAEQMMKRRRSGYLLGAGRHKIEVP